MYFPTSSILLLTFTNSTSTVFAPASETTYSYAKRNAWCVDEDVPCRLAQYSPLVIQDACAKYLPHGYSDSYGKVVTVTQHVWGPIYTETVTAGPCDYGYPAGPPPPPYEPDHDYKPDEPEYHDDKPAPDYDHEDELEYHNDKPAPDYEHEDEPEYDDGEGPPTPDYYPDAGPYDDSGDGEDKPAYPGGDDGYGDGEDAPDYLDGSDGGDGTADDWDLPYWAHDDGSSGEDGVW